MASRVKKRRATWVPTKVTFTEKNHWQTRASRLPPKITQNMASMPENSDVSRMAGLRANQ